MSVGFISLLVVERNGFIGLANLLIHFQKHKLTNSTTQQLINSPTHQLKISQTSKLKSLFNNRFNLTFLQLGNDYIALLQVVGVAYYLSAARGDAVTLAKL